MLCVRMIHDSRIIVIVVIIIIIIGVFINIGINTTHLMGVQYTCVPFLHFLA